MGYSLNYLLTYLLAYLLACLLLHFTTTGCGGSLIYNSHLHFDSIKEICHREIFILLLRRSPFIVVDIKDLTIHNKRFSSIVIHLLLFAIIISFIRNYHLLNNNFARLHNICNLANCELLFCLDLMIILIAK